jgi:dienelactone hydrolase
VALSACGIVVEGELQGRPLNVEIDPARVIVVIWNHGFSPEAAGTYRPEAPAIIERLVEKNRDVVLFKQLRNGAWLGELDHGAYVDAAIASLVSAQHVPVENIVLSGQSCGAWGSLQTAAFRYPNVGGVIAFAPTCHGKLPHPEWLRTRRAEEIAGLARRLRAPGTLFVYDGDSFYSADDWTRFAVETPPPPGPHLERLTRARVLEVCHACVSDSHSAVWGEGFADAYFESHLQPLIERVRQGITRRAAVQR